MKLRQNLINADVKRALEEDVGQGDVTAALLPADRVIEAEIINREPMLVCGQPWVEAVFAQLDPNIQIDWQVQEGQWLPEPGILCSIKGLARPVLTGERTALNFMQTLSGTATQTYHCLHSLKNTVARLLDTRKTLPGLRYAQKYAVFCAGGTNHRMGLDDAFLIKENHIRACGSITKAVQRAREVDDSLLLEIEIETLAELEEALNAQPDRILLDNFTHAMLTEAVAISDGRGCELEASGGITSATLKSVAETGVDYISLGTITKSVHAIDLSLLIRQRDAQ